MQPSSAFSILKQLTNMGRWISLDKELLSDVAHNAEPTAEHVAPLSDLNRDKTNMTKEATASNLVDIGKLKSKASELDVITSAGNFDSIMNVGKENMNVINRVSVESGQLQSRQVKHSAILNDWLGDGMAENLDEIDGFNGYDAADVTLCHCSPKPQPRKTFSLGATNGPSYSAVQSLPMQSDSIDVMNVIGEVAGIFQGSGQLSDVDSDDDFSTQDIEAHKEGNISSAAKSTVMPVAEHVTICDSSSQQSVDNTTTVDVELTVKQAAEAVALAVTTVATVQVSQSVSVPQHVSEKSPQCVPPQQVRVVEATENKTSQLEPQVEGDSGDLEETKISDEENAAESEKTVASLPKVNEGVDCNQTAVPRLPSLHLINDIGNNVSLLLANDSRSEDMVSATVDEQQQVKVSPAAEGAEILSELAAKACSHGIADVVNTDAVGKNGGTKQQSVNSAELLSSQLDDDNDSDDNDRDDDSESGELNM